MNRIHLQNLSVVSEKISSRQAIKIFLENEKIFRVGYLLLKNSGGQLSGIISSSELLASVNLGNESILCHANTSPLIASLEETENSIERKLKIHPIIPIVDSVGEIFGAYSRQPVKNIARLSADKFVGKNLSPIIIAEIGNNHNGSYEACCELIDSSIEAGVDAVKFQHRNIDSLYQSGALHGLGAEYIKNLSTRFSLNIVQLKKAISYANSLGVLSMCTPWDIESLRELEDTDVCCYKVASADFTNKTLISSIFETGKPVVLSCGMTELKNIYEMLGWLGKNFNNYCVLHCNSAYPPAYSDLNLKFISNLVEITDIPIGYSSHEKGIHATTAAIALGASVVEKHVTLDKNWEGSDHKISLLPEELRKLVVQVKEVHEAIGTGTERQLSQGELINRVGLSKSAFLINSMKKGETLAQNNIQLKSPGNGILPHQLNEFIGKQVVSDLETGHMLERSDFFGKKYNAKFDFERRWGVPVRHKDVALFDQLFDCPLFEIHFSSDDIELEHSKYFSHMYGRELIFHAPEMFSNDHIIDLATADKTYLKKSVQNLERTFEACLEIYELQGLTGKPKLIVNCGGFSENGFFSDREITSSISRMRDNLLRLNSSSVEILPQTMPPFPWHFGGRRFHNLFTRPDNILSLIEQTDLKLCIDVSHSAMMCNFDNTALSEFLQRIGPYSCHAHIADTVGVSGEGMPIGEGEINFEEISKFLPSCVETFIIEVWQGHENSGELFKKGLSKLEGLF